MMLVYTCIILFDIFAANTLILQAAEPNEMSLIEGEYIEKIEELEDGKFPIFYYLNECSSFIIMIGWWEGVAVADKSRTGLFPGM
jgi:hypothetical protein